MSCHCPSHGEVLAESGRLHCPLCGLPLLVNADGGHGLRWLDDANRRSSPQDVLIPGAWTVDTEEAAVIRKILDPANPLGKRISEPLTLPTLDRFPE